MLERLENRPLAVKVRDTILQAILDERFDGRRRCKLERADYGLRHAHSSSWGRRSYLGSHSMPWHEHRVEGSPSCSQGARMDWY